MSLVLIPSIKGHRLLFTLKNFVLENTHHLKINLTHFNTLLVLKFCPISDADYLWSTIRNLPYCWKVSFAWNKAQMHYVLTLLKFWPFPKLPKTVNTMQIYCYTYHDKRITMSVVHKCPTGIMDTKLHTFTAKILLWKMLPPISTYQHLDEPHPFQ